MNNRRDTPEANVPRYAKKLRADAERLKAKCRSIRESRRQPFTVRNARIDALLRIIIEKEQIALALETAGLPPQEKARWIREQRIKAEKEGV